MSTEPTALPEGSRWQSKTSNDNATHWVIRNGEPRTVYKGREMGSRLSMSFMVSDVANGGMVPCDEHGQPLPQASNDHKCPNCGGYAATGYQPDLRLCTTHMCREVYTVGQPLPSPALTPTKAEESMMTWACRRCGSFGNTLGELCPCCGASALNSPAYMEYPRPSPAPVNVEAGERENAPLTVAEFNRAKVDWESITTNAKPDNVRTDKGDELVYTLRVTRSHCVALTKVFAAARKSFDADAAALRKRVETLEKALRSVLPYLRHNTSCDYNVNGHCDCGLSATESGARADLGGDAVYEAMKHVESKCPSKDGWVLNGELGVQALPNEYIEAAYAEMHPINPPTEGPPMTLPKSGIDLIAEERQRHVSVEGWTTEHDNQHTDNELAMAAVCYAMPDDERIYFGKSLPEGWPWDWKFWKPTPDDRIRELVKAGALIAAEIDRLQRQKAVVTP